MEDEITIDSLIQEQKNRMGSLQKLGNMIIYYEFDDMQSYRNWVTKTIRFLELKFPEDKHINDFITTSKQELYPDQQQKLLAILEAFASFPVIIPNKKEEKDNRLPININTNINNSNRQSQSQSIDIFTEAIKDDLTGSQIKELKEVVEQENGDLKKARPKLIEKLMYFGKDVASNIVANLLTNPSIWSHLQ